MLTPAVRRPLLLLLHVLAPLMLVAASFTRAAVPAAVGGIPDEELTAWVQESDGKFRRQGGSTWPAEIPFNGTGCRAMNEMRRGVSAKGSHMEDVTECDRRRRRRRRGSVATTLGLWENSSSMSSSTVRGWRLWTAVVAGAATALLSSAGGVGGGGLYVPIFNLLLGFDSKTSAALSSCTIVGGIFVNVFFYSFQTRHRPFEDEPLIDYRMTLLFLPNLLLGISAGVMFNVMSPDWLVTAAFVVAVSSMTFRTCRTAIRRWRTESSVRIVGSDKEKADLERPLLQAEKGGRLALLLRRFPPVEIVLLVVIWLLFLAVQILRGTSDGENLFDIETCGTVYWIITSLQIPLAILLTVCAILYLTRTSINEDDDPLAAGEEESPQDLTRESLRDGRSMVKMSAVALVVGIVGGMLGLGGGTIVNPLFTEMGMDPQVTAATTSFMVFFSSSLSVVQYWLLGRIPDEYALASAALALLFSAVGLQVIRSFIVRYGRVSLIVFSVSTVMGISAVLMAGLGSWDIWLQIQQGEYMGFQLPC